jgi:hypothetical protein
MHPRAPASSTRGRWCFRWWSDGCLQNHGDSCCARRHRPLRCSAGAVRKPGPPCGCHRRQRQWLWWQPVWVNDDAARSIDCGPCSAPIPSIGTTCPARSNACAARNCWRPCGRWSGWAEAPAAAECFLRSETRPLEPSWGPQWPLWHQSTEMGPMLWACSLRVTAIAVRRGIRRGCCTGRCGL